MSTVWRRAQGPLTVADNYSRPAPVLAQPEPQRIKPDMSNHIQDGLRDLSLDGQRNGFSNRVTATANDVASVSPFPRLVNPPPNVPPSDEQLEETLEKARGFVLSSNDAEMQLAWAADTLVYVGICADNEERIVAAKPLAARPGTPRVEHQLKVDAMNIVTFLADQHHPKAEFLRGMWLEWGRFGQREDKKEAFRCYSRAADRGYARAEYRIGMLYESYNDPVKALRHYHRGVEAGDAASCYRLGMLTLRGQLGQPQDTGLGIDLIRRSAIAADENAAQGAYVYGMLLARQLPQIHVPDHLLPYDERQAKMFIEKAAYLKFAKAQLQMGSAYELGSLDCEFSPTLSMHYNALASRQGEAQADMALSKWFLVGAEGLFPKNEELAYTYAERAAHTGLPTAEFAMGYFYEIGMYVAVDLKRATMWYEKASKHGNEDARQRLESLSRSQVLNKKDHMNVAITRIKSQHGSMRMARPARFQQPRPAGPESRLAYPLESAPPNVDPTPYPMDDSPLPEPRRTGPVGGFFNPSSMRPATAVEPKMRPSSTLALNPDVRSNSATPQMVQNRPHAGQPISPAPASRPLMHSQQPVRGPRGPRVASGPATIQQQQRPPQSQLPPQAAYPTGPSILPAPQRTNTAPPQQHSIPEAAGLDFGFAAPLKPSAGGMGGGRLPQTGNMPTLDPPPMHDSRPATASWHGPRPLASMSPPPVGGGLVTSASTPSMDMHSRPGTSTGRVDVPSSSGAQSSAYPILGPHSTGPPPHSVGPSPSPSVTPSAAPSTAPSAPPPKKGPKTFDEMGVPAQKQDNDCVVM
ncbi:HCP-like protein [Piedraia hortae CBS 480.64]|uniref:HCP-like protein n=1 Tax=Piedraia hortae CBS 480.64 TaxID=1314780 RepID=A0A6A7BUL3_9PEZI|nr:HCP-like protein [Piedraia hortae CBS 480.64]